jgi:hypothetical protein
MMYFIISYRVLVDNSLHLKGLTGNFVVNAKHSRDYKPLEVAEMLKEEYHLQYPHAHSIRVQFGNVQAVDEARYHIASQDFTMPLRMCEACVA